MEVDNLIQQTAGAKAPAFLAIHHFGASRQGSLKDSIETASLNACFWLQNLTQKGTTQ